MQITPVNLPPTPSAALPPQTITNVLPEVQAQAAQPISNAAITPSGSAEKKQKAQNKDKDKRATGQDDEMPPDPKRGHQLNISV